MKTLCTCTALVLYERWPENHFDVRYVDRPARNRVVSLRFWYEDEGVKWCRGWEDAVAVSALRAAIALA